MHAGEGSSSSDPPKSSYSHICNRSAPSMSVNVGMIFAVYHGRSLTTCDLSWPFKQSHRIVSDPTNHVIGCAPSTLRSLQTRGSCPPRCCLLSKHASSALHLRQDPEMTNSAVTVGSVATRAWSRHSPAGSRTRTTATGSALHPRYHST